KISLSVSAMALTRSRSSNAGTYSVDMVFSFLRSRPVQALDSRWKRECSGYDAARNFADVGDEVHRYRRHRGNRAQRNRDAGHELRALLTSAASRYAPAPGFQKGEAGPH